MPPFVMQQFSEIEPLRAELKTLAGVKVAFVPTMGSLHAGHLALVRRARELADFVVVSIYVNPTQFGKGEDFSTYPKSLVQDILKLEEAGADLLFTPSDEVIYPGRGESSDGGSCRVELPAVSEVLCGESRPGHFSGVATVVAKLFNIVMPDISLFGEKDFQQLHIIRRMVADLNFPIEIVGVSTVRDSDGLALSSRNEYLTLEQRSVAPELYRVLCWVVGEVKQAERAVAEIEQDGVDMLQRVGFEVDYLSLRFVNSLASVVHLNSAAQYGKEELVLLVAAKLGSTRLLDNIHFDTIS